MSPPLCVLIWWTDFREIRGYTWNVKSCYFIEPVSDDYCSVGPPDSWEWRCNNKNHSSQWHIIVASFNLCNLLPKTHCCITFPSLHFVTLSLSKMFPCQNSICISYVADLSHLQYAQQGNIFRHLGSVVYFVLFLCFLYYSLYSRDLISQSYKVTGKINNWLGKAIPVQAWTHPKGSRRLRLPDFKTVSTWM